VTLGLEMSDMSGLARAARASGRKTISISSEHLFQHSNIHDYGRYADVDLAIGGDAEASLPLLIEETRKLTTPEKRQAFATGSRRRTSKRTRSSSRTHGTGGSRARSASRA
jgi:hypothetical protein